MYFLLFYIQVMIIKLNKERSPGRNLISMPPSFLLFTASLAASFSWQVNESQEEEKNCKKKLNTLSADDGENKVEQFVELLLSSLSHSLAGLLRMLEQNHIKVVSSRSPVLNEDTAMAFRPSTTYNLIKIISQIPLKFPSRFSLSYTTRLHCTLIVVCDKCSSRAKLA
jgi:hypothetical protein